MSAPLSSTEQEVLTVIRAFFKYLNTPDVPSMRPLVLPDGGVMLIRPPGSTLESTVRSKTANLSATPRLDSKPIINHMKLSELLDQLEAFMHDPNNTAHMEEHIDEARTVVKVDEDGDGDLAVAWTPYRVEYDGMVHHTGTNVFSLAKVEGSWMISGVADNCKLVKQAE